jgi:hypothetical protein
LHERGCDLALVIILEVVKQPRRASSSTDADAPHEVQRTTARELIARHDPIDEERHLQRGIVFLDSKRAGVHVFCSTIGFLLVVRVRDFLATQPSYFQHASLLIFNTTPILPKES